jgi:hypothetical protein
MKEEAEKGSASGFAEGARSEQIEIKSIDDLLGVVEVMGKLPGGANLIKSLIHKGYDGAVGKYRPLIKVVPDILELAGQDMAPVFAALLRLANDVYEDEDIQIEIERGRETRAENRKKILAAYTDAGFTPNQAFALLLLDSSPRATAGSARLIDSATSLLDSALPAAKSAKAAKKPPK